MSTKYQYIIEGIKPTSNKYFEKAKARLDSLAKPPESLGKLEEIAARLCSITEDLSPIIDKRCVIVLAADNGVVAEGVASAPQSVTAAQTINMLNGLTGVSVLAKQFNADCIVADVGVKADIQHPNLVCKKIRYSTGNIAKEPAMSQAEVDAAVMAGVELVLDAKKAGYTLIGVGEMGIGNTTTSSAVLAALLELDDVEAVVGKGGGLKEEDYQNKVKVIKTALDLHQPNAKDPTDILRKVGGLDIAAMTGVYLAAAYGALPIVVDGFISAVAALCAVRINPLVAQYLFASHKSSERGYAAAIKELGLAVSLELDMRLGEGSGCPLMFSVMDASLAILKNMATFDEAKINDDYLDGIRENIDCAF